VYQAYPDKRRQCRALTRTSIELQEIVMTERAVALTNFVAAAILAAIASPHPPRTDSIGHQNEK
jgi:hypothetical protein